MSYQTGWRVGFSLLPLRGGGEDRETYRKRRGNVNTWTPYLRVKLEGEEGGRREQVKWTKGRETY